MECVNFGMWRNVSHFCRVKDVGAGENCLRAQAAENLPPGRGERPIEGAEE